MLRKGKRESLPLVLAKLMLEKLIHNNSFVWLNRWSMFVART